MKALVLLLPTLFDPWSGGHQTKDDERNPVVMPEQRIEVTFDHAKHLAEAGLTCIDCHEGVTESTKTKDYNIPSRDLCLDCHDGDEIPWRWSKKAKDPKNAIALPPAHLHFAHSIHMELEGVSCATCHPGVEEAGLATRAHLPSMETCLTCHDGTQAADSCTTCHLEGWGGRIKTAFAEGELIPDDHGELWASQHEVHGERDLEYCASCHAQTDCLSCHEGSLPPTFHDGGYLHRHPQEAMANSPVCASCHRLETFCQDCHFRAGVTFDSGRWSFDTFHPPGWADFPPFSTAEHHSKIAKKNISSCTACHVQEDCVSCHAWYVGAPRTHPAGWADSDAMRTLRRENFGLCMECHDGSPGDPINGP
ncbi:MAG: cytochrome c3 family protein [Acidobacteriota bacterium]